MLIIKVWYVTKADTADLTGNDAISNSPQYLLYSHDDGVGILIDSLLIIEWSVNGTADSSTSEESNSD